MAWYRAQPAWLLVAWACLLAVRVQELLLLVARAQQSACALPVAEPGRALGWVQSAHFLAVHLGRVQVVRLLLVARVQQSACVLPVGVLEPCLGWVQSEHLLAVHLEPVQAALLVARVQSACFLRAGSSGAMPGLRAVGALTGCAFGACAGGAATAGCSGAAVGMWHAACGSSGAMAWAGCSRRTYWQCIWEPVQVVLLVVRVQSACLLRAGVLELCLGCVQSAHLLAVHLEPVQVARLLLVARGAAVGMCAACGSSGAMPGLGAVGALTGCAFGACAGGAATAGCSGAAVGMCAACGSSGLGAVGALTGSAFGACAGGAAGCAGAVGAPDGRVGAGGAPPAATCAGSALQVCLGRIPTPPFAHERWQHVALTIDNIYNVQIVYSIYIYIDAKRYRYDR